MVRVCASEGCKISARFNHLGEQKGKFCSRHKEPGMIDIVHPHCKIEGCTTLASFNMPGESRGEFCSQHKQEGMVNVKHRRCAENGCNTRPAFNWKGEEKGSFCNKHKEKGMVNVDKKEARADGAAGAGADPPRKRSKAAQQPMPHDMAQHSQQQDGFDPARLAQQLPELAALATGEANGFMGMQHALHYGHLPPEFAAANALGVNVPVPLDPSQRLPPEQLAHHLDARSAHAGVAGVPDMGQAVWSAAAAQEHHRQALDQQQQQQHERVSEGQQMSQHPATAPQQGHSHMGLEQHTAHLQQHLVQQLQGGDTNPGMHQQHMAQSLEQQQEQLQQDGREYIDQHQPEPSLPSAEELRQRVKLGETGSAEAAAAPAGSLGHLMLVQVIKFVRESLETQIVTDEGRQQLMMFTDHFSQWPEDKRVEEYAMLHFSWSVGREDKQHAVLQRVEKVLAV